MSVIHSCFAPLSLIDPELHTKIFPASDYWSPDDSQHAYSDDKHCLMARSALYNTAISKYEAVYTHPESGVITISHSRLDNRNELCERLHISSDFPYPSDAELITQIYLNQGKTFIHHLVGDFVFALYDPRKQTLLCARDRLGIKGIFYSIKDNRIMLTSEHNAFFTSGWANKCIDEAWLVRHLWRIGPQPFSSPYKEISTLPPGHYLEFNQQGLTIEKYWDLYESDEYKKLSHDELIEGLKERFEIAVKRRLDSDFPISAELSEGLDSSSITGTAAKQLYPHKIHTLSYECHKLTKNNQDIWAHAYQTIAPMYVLHENLHPIWVNNQPQPLADKDFHRFYHHFGGLQDLNGGHFVRSAIAAETGSRTLLSGWGGDHCVTSFGQYYDSELLNQRQFLKLYKHLQAMHRQQRGARPAIALAKLIKKHLFSKSHYQYSLVANSLVDRAKLHFLKKTYQDKYQCWEQLEQFIQGYERYSVKDYHQRELLSIGVDHRLWEAELVGRMNRIEYRFPMLDHQLVEYAYNMPSELKIYNGIDRYMFRKTLDGVVPHEAQWRKKMGNSQWDYVKAYQVHQRRESMLKSAMESELFHQYGDAKKAEAYIRYGDRLMMTRPFELLLSLESQLKSSDVEIIPS